MPRGTLRARGALASVALLACGGVVASPRAARAQHAPAARAVTPAPRRARPDYDGRGPAPATVGDALAWGPRVVLFPLRAALEVFRWPTARILLAGPVRERLSGERAGHRAREGEAPEPHVRFVPHAVFDAGRRFHAGLAVEYSRRASEGDRLALLAATGGERFWVADARAAASLAPGAELGLRGYLFERPDHVVYGAPGPDTAQRDEQRFWMRRAGASALVSFRAPWGGSLDVATGVRRVEVELGAQPWLASTQTPGADRYTALATEARAAFDSRGGGDRQPATGARVALRARHGADLGDVAARRWVSAGVDAGVYLAIAPGGRVLGLEATATITEPLGRAPVPFPELAALGGDDNPMRGFYDGRFRGPAAASVALRYRWPVWVLLEGETRVAVGNAFGPGFAGLAPGALFGSWDFGVRSRFIEPARVEFLLGLGTSRFDSPTFAIEQVRCLLAISRDL